MSKNSFATAIALVAVMSAGWVGCGKKTGASGASGGAGSENLAAAKPPVPATPPQSAKPPGATTAPAGQSVVALWKQGDKVKAIDSFVAADWKAQPLFPADSVMSLSEAQFVSASPSDIEARRREMLEEVTPLKQLGAAVANAGLDAAARNDTEAANDHFNALKQCGQALDNPNFTKLLRLVGQGFQKRADKELAKLPPR